MPDSTSRSPNHFQLLIPGLFPTAVVARSSASWPLSQMRDTEHHGERMPRVQSSQIPANHDQARQPRFVEWPALLDRNPGTWIPQMDVCRRESDFRRGLVGQAGIGRDSVSSGVGEVVDSPSRSSSNSASARGAVVSACRNSPTMKRKTIKPAINTTTSAKPSCRT